MPIWNWLKTQFQAWGARLRILKGKARILFCRVAKRVLLELWKALSSLFTYIVTHSNELICNLLTAVIAGVIAGCIVAWITL